MAEKEFEKALARSIGENVRIARERLGLTREEAATRVGISYEFFARIERAHSLPGLRTLRNLAEALAVSVDTLLGSVGDDWAIESESDASRDAIYVIHFARHHPSVVRLLTALIKETEDAQKPDDDD